MLKKTTDLAITLACGAVFLVIVTPVGLLLRMFGVDFLRGKIDPGASSYWRKHV